MHVLRASPETWKNALIKYLWDAGSGCEISPAHIYLLPWQADSSACHVPLWRLFGKLPHLHGQNARVARLLVYNVLLIYARLARCLALQRGS